MKIHEIVGKFLNPGLKVADNAVKATTVQARLAIARKKQAEIQKKKIQAQNAQKSALMQPLS